jgi:hypothetical protein
MWTYKDEILENIPEGYVGMVYMITNIATNKKYIGKKIFHFTKTKQVKGKKKRSKVESDWKNYYGSNKELNEHVELFGVNNFKREILHLCVNKSQMSYLELREQIDRRVLETEEYYNEWISAKVRKTKHLTNL